MKTTMVYDGTMVYGGTWITATFISRPQHDWLLINYPVFLNEIMKNLKNKQKKWCLAGVTIPRNEEIESLLRGYVVNRLAYVEPKRKDFKFVM